MVDFSKPIQTRDGRSVEIITMKGRNSFPVVGYVSESLDSWTAEGYYRLDKEFDRLDIINIPEPTIVYLRVLDNGVAFTEASNASHNYRNRGIRFKITLVAGQPDKIERVNS